MKTIKFYEIPEHISGLEFDGDKKDTRLFHEDQVRWFEKDQDKYEEIEKFLQNYVIETEHYQIYGGYDVSGYEYWVQDMRESNYVYLTIYFKSEDVPAEILPKLEEDIDTAIHEFYTLEMDYEEYDEYINEEEE